MKRGAPYYKTFLLLHACLFHTGRAQLLAFCLWYWGSDSWEKKQSDDVVSPMSVYCRHCYCCKKDASGNTDLGRDLGSKASLNLALSTDSKFLCHGNRILKTWNDSICSSLLWPAWLWHAMPWQALPIGVEAGTGWFRWQIYRILKWDYKHKNETVVRI